MSRINLERTAQEMSWGSRMRARDHWSRVINTISGMDRHALATEINKADVAYSLNLFAQDNYFRMKIKAVTDSRYFDWFILTMIMLNCMALAAYDPTADSDNLSSFGRSLEIAELVFLSVFTLEMVMKIIAYGLYSCGPSSYLKNRWNLLDGFIVVIGLLGLLLSGLGNSSVDVRALRAFRVLRPLRLVTSLQSLRIVLNSILLSIPTLNQVAMLLLFLITIFAIIGLDFYKGRLDYQCFVPAEGVGNDTSGYKLYNGSFYTLAQSEGPCNPRGMGFSCVEPATCLPSLAPNDGVTSFNNAGLAILTVFQCITLEGWTDVLYATNAANGEPALNWLFFVTLVIVGAFFVMNLVLGVLSSQFTREGERMKANVKFFRERRKLESRRLLSNYREWLEAGLNMSSSHRQDYLPDKLQRYDRTKFQNWDPRMAEADDRKNFRLEHEGDDETVGHDDLTLVLCLALPSGRRGYVRAEPGQTLGDVRQTILHNYLDEDPARVMSDKFCHPRDGHIISDSSTVNDIGVRMRRLHEYMHVLTLVPHNQHALLKQSTLQMLPRLGAVTKARWFALTILVLVLVNTILLATSADIGDDGKAARAYGIAEVIFISLFVLEGVIKMIGLGFKTYFESRFNCFDFIVVVGSVLELIIVRNTSADPIGLSAMRTLRLLRILREFPQYWEDINDFVAALIASVGSILALLLLLAIFLVIIALLGMQIFGGRFNFDPGNKPRLNFDDFGSAMLTIFLVLTGEDWNAVMYNGIQAYGGIFDMGWVSIVFFCITVIIGTFVLLNVFLAIAVKSLDDAKDMKLQREEHNEKFDIVVDELTLTEDEREERRRNRVYINPLLSQQIHTLSGPKRRISSQSVVSNNYLLQKMSANTSLFCLKPDNPLRKFCHRIAFDQRFDASILLLILISSALLAVENPVDPDAQINKDLVIADIVFTSIFALEMLLKIISVGGIAYVRDPWNDLDALVVFASIASLAASSGDVAIVRILRVLRVLRPLRAIKRAPGLRHVVQCMIVSVKTIGNVFIVTFLFNFIFAVIGVQSFQGCFAHCNDGSDADRVDCVGFFNSTLSNGTIVAEPRVWENAFFNFDSVGEGMLTLFTVATLEGWVGVMQNAQDCVGEGQAPSRSHNPVAALFFVAYIVLVAFFMLNVFVGYVITTFSEEGERAFKDSGLDKNQRKCIAFCIKARPIIAYRPKYRVQLHPWKLVTSTVFEWFIQAAILGNTIVLLVQYEGMPDHYQDALGMCNIVFTLVFTAEALLKLFAHNPTAYFHDAWNIFDFLIVAGSLPDVAITLTGATGVSLGFLRLFRAARLIKLVGRGNGMRRLLWTFVKSFKSLPWVALLIVMVFFVYAVIGMQVFGPIGYRMNGSINEDNNFRAFFSAILLLFRCATGENWQLMMQDCVLGRDGCDANTDEFCGSWFAVPYFVSFVVIMSFLVLNLFVAVIMDNFEYLTQDESHLGENDLPRFIELWSRFDPKGTGYIGHTELVQLLREEPPPLGFGKKCPEDCVLVKMLRLSIPLRPDGTVQFNAALLAILRVNLDIYSTSSGLPVSERNVELRQKLRSNFEIEDDMLDTLLPPASYTGMTTGEHYAAWLMQRLYRQARRRRYQVRQQAATERVPLEAGLREEQRRPGLVLRRTLSSDDLHAASAVSRPTRMQLPPTPVDQLSIFSASHRSQLGDGSGGASFA